MESRYNVRVVDRISEADIRKVFIDVMQTVVQEDGGSAPLDKMNFRVMSIAKDLFKNRLVGAAVGTAGGEAAPAPVPAPAPALMQMPQPMPQPAPMPMHQPMQMQDQNIMQIQQLRVMEAEQKARDESQSSINPNDFFKKIKEIEDQRRQAMEAAASTYAPAPPPLLPPQDMRRVLPQAQAPAQSTSTGVPLPTPSYQLKAKQFIINSWERKWQFSPSRNIFIWGGPLPRGTFEMVCALIPRRASNHPYITIELVGAGGQSDSFIMVPSGSGSSSAGGWEKYVPVVGDGIPLSCPWTVKISGALGEDSNIISQSTERSQASGGGVHLQVTGSVDEFTIGDSLLIQCNGVAAPITATVIGIGRSATPGVCFIDVQAAELPTVGGQILNMSHQVSIIFRLR